MKKQNSGGHHIPHVHSEGTDLSGLGAEKIQLECVKEEEKHISDAYSDSSEGGEVIKKPVTSASSSKRLKKTTAV